MGEEGGVLGALMSHSKIKTRLQEKFVKCVVVNALF